MNKPNIILFFTDQQRWDTIAASGNRHIQTPHLDRMAREGTLFDSPYSPSPASLVDIMPTVLSAAGASAEKNDGVDLAALAEGSVKRDLVFGHYPSYRGDIVGIYMAVSEKWKYIWSAVDGKEFLFDRVRDPDELRNRAYSFTCSAAVSQMRGLLQEHVRSMPGGEEFVDENGWILKAGAGLPDDPDAELLSLALPPVF